MSNFEVECAVFSAIFKSKTWHAASCVVRLLCRLAASSQCKAETWKSLYATNQWAAELSKLPLDQRVVQVFTTVKLMFEFPPDQYVCNSNVADLGPKATSDLGRRLAFRRGRSYTVDRLIAGMPICWFMIKVCGVCSVPTVQDVRRLSLY